MKWQEKVLIYKIFLKVWAQFNEAYAQANAERSTPKWVAQPPLTNLASQYRLIESPKKLVEQDC